MIWQYYQPASTKLLHENVCQDSSAVCRAQAHAAAEIVRHAGEKVDLLQSQQRPPPAHHLSVLQQQELLRRLDSLSLHAQVLQ